MSEVKYDEIGYWSEVKLDIVKKYAVAYSTVLAAQPNIKSHIYIDAFAGPGTHISKATGDFVAGSPRNALLVHPPFKEYHFIDLEGWKANLLRELKGDRADVFVYEEDCNEVLLKKVFPRVRYMDYRRALCLLDPYKINLNWEVIKTAGQEKSIEIFPNFMVMDANMNVLKHDQSKVLESQAQRMTTFWGDESWRDAAYEKSAGLFDEMQSKSTNSALVEAFRKRLKEQAGFAFVPEPIPMRNTRGAVVYYLYFASPNETGAKIVKDIFDKYRNTGMH